MTRYAGFGINITDALVDAAQRVAELDRSLLEARIRLAYVEWSQNSGARKKRAWRKYKNLLAKRETP